MIHQPAPIRRLIETLGFFRIYGMKIGIPFLLLYLPVVALNVALPFMADESTSKSGLLGLSYLIQFMYQPIYTGALIFWLARIEAGEPWSLKDGAVVGVALWDKMILANLISHVLIVVGLLALIIPGLIAYARLALAEFSIVLDGDAAREAIRRSFVITRPFAWEILASSGILFLAFLYLEIVLSWINGLLSGGIIMDLAASSLLSVVLMINLTILLFRFYGLAVRRAGGRPEGSGDRGV
ncbi:MAG: hypothetical protein ACOWWM_10765 [Desulfobacterales bacterium]